jgi:hypothetical protein
MGKYVYHAKVEKGVVTDIRAVTRERIESRPDLYPGTWIPFNDDPYVSQGWTWSLDDGFRPPRPFPSWIFNETDFLWEAPIPMPQDGKNYEWDEINIQWVEILDNENVHEESE